MSDADGDDHLGALSRGTMLFEYRIDAVLGYGGFGITYLAEDTHLNEVVAIKEYFPSHTAVRTGDQSARARSKREAQAFRAGVESFLSEARIIARFRHPNIMQVRRFFEAHGTGYMVLEFIQGQSLEVALGPGPLPEPQVRALLGGILDGLAALHDQAILHRDLKPRNVILRRDGSPVLIDFGAARDFGARHSATVTQIVSPYYASPEQYGVGEQQGPWSDFYALGAILYRAVTGSVPVDALRRLRADPLEPAKSAAKGRYSPALLALVDTLLAVEATQRPATAGDVRHLLTSPMERSGPPTPVPSASPQKKSPWAGLAHLPGLDRLRTHPMLAGVAILVALLLFGGVAAVDSLHRRSPATPKAPDATHLASGEPNAAAQTHPPESPGTPAAHAPKVQSEPRRPDHLEAGATFKDCTDCPTMSVVPAGSFQMGSGARADEMPVHAVRIASPFAIGQREVTVAEWAACAAAGGCGFRPDNRGPGHADDPVTDLSWRDTQDYLAWLSKRSGHPYRLPSEAEWEYAARGGTTSAFWWGDATGEDHANCAGCGPKAHGAVAATASYPANLFGLYDTAGNASEWVADCWSDNYAGAPADGQAVSGPDCSQHVLRGGGFNNDAVYARSASRLKYGTAVRYYANGFRVASDIDRP